jgi:hypothetical protein
MASRNIQVGPVTTHSGGDVPARMAILLWGLAGCGKTTLAATAPGTKLWLSFGDQEHVSVMHRKDVETAHLAEVGVDDLFKHAQSDNPFGLDQTLEQCRDIETVVLDSATALAFRALQKAVKDKVGASKRDGFVPTMMAPGQGAYGGRNAIVLEVLTGLLKVTAKHGVHLIITAHEDDPVKDGAGVVQMITTMLGGKLVTNLTWRLSEIWHMSQSLIGEKERRIAIRPYGLRRPMKTRMFSDKGPASFVLDYDADVRDDAPGQMTIERWYTRWIEGHGAKLPVPGESHKKLPEQGKVRSETSDLAAPKRK